jgi:acyl-CoA synthetase (NDP forming)
MNLAPLFAPASIAVVGASADPAKLASRPLRILQETGFAGRLYAVNPGRDSVLGVPSVPNPRDLPEPVDVGVVMVPAAAVPTAVADLATRGTRHVIVLSAGFNETAEGQEHARRLRQVVVDHDLRLVGPNSEGVWSIPGRALMTHGTAALGRELVTGSISILSQSGSIGAALTRAALDRGPGIRYLVSLGNELGLTLVDCLEYLVAERASRVVVLFIEGLTDGHRLPAVLREARAAGVVVIAVKAGVSPLGRHAVQTHTGKLATPGRVYADVVRSCGHLVVDGIAEAVAAARTLAANLSAPADPAPPADPAAPPGPAGPCAPDGTGAGAGLGIVSASGGSRALLADEAWRRGLPLARFAASTRAAVDTAMAGRGVADNPIDVDVEALYDTPRFLAVLEAVAADPAVGTLVVQLANRGAQQLPDLATHLLALRARRPKPVIVSLLLDDAEPAVVRRLATGGVVVVGDPGAAVAQAALLSARSPGSPAAALVTGSPPAARAVPPAAAAPDPATGDRPRPSWPEHVAAVAGAGVRVVPWRIVRDRRDLADAADTLAPPWVLKALPEQADHKSELGLVHLDLRTLDAAEAAMASLRRALGADAPLLLQELVPGGVDLVLAARRDPDLGPLLVLGRGGVAVELEDDIVHVPADADDEEILAALRTLRVHAWLRGFRGRPPADVPAVVTAARRLGSALVTDPELSELEINPLVVLPEGAGAVAVDLRMRRR